MTRNNDLMDWPYILPDEKLAEVDMVTPTFLQAMTRVLKYSGTIDEDVYVHQKTAVELPWSEPFAVGIAERWLYRMDSILPRLRQEMFEHGTNSPLAYVLLDALEGAAHDLGVLMHFAGKTWEHDPMILERFGERIDDMSETGESRSEARGIG